MPQGCGTWPAAWEVNEENWPGQGEVDIVRAALSSSYLRDVLTSSYPLARGHERHRAEPRDAAHGRKLRPTRRARDDGQVRGEEL